MTSFFVGVGVQRAGCAWLRQQLAAHPQVAVAQGPELHYFDSAHPLRTGGSYGARHIRAVRQHVKGGRPERAKAVLDLLDLVFRGPSAYRKHLEGLAGPTTRAVGEITPGYGLLTDQGFAAMREALDGPKVLVVLRDPIDRYWSALRALDPERAPRRFARNRPVDVAHLAQSDYVHLVPALDAAFGADVLYLFFEELFSEAALRRVARHLGVDEQWDWTLEPPAAEGDEAESAMPEPSQTLRSQFGPQYDFALERFGADLPSSWRLEGRLQGQRA